MFCPNCGAQSEDTAQFCLKCGKPLPSLVQEQRARGRRHLLWAALVPLVVVVLVGGAISWFFWFRPLGLGKSEVEVETDPTPVSGLMPEAEVSYPQPAPEERTPSSTPPPPSSTAPPTIMPTPAMMTVEVATATPPPTSTPPLPPTPTLSATSPPTATPILAPTSPSAPEPSALFEDDFGGSSLNGTLWAVDRGDGVVAISGGILRMSSSGARFPYVYSRVDPFPAQGDFQMTVRLRYSNVRDCGVGIIMASYLVPAGLSQEEAASLQQEAESHGVQAGVWQDRASGLQLWFRSGADRKDVVFPGPNTGWIELAIRYSDGRYSMYLNGSHAYSSLETVYRPGYIWMGHPADLGYNCQWDTLEIDYVRVEMLP
jgi:hypothetical protein